MRSVAGEVPYAAAVVITVLLNNAQLGRINISRRRVNFPSSLVLVAEANPGLSIIRFDRASLELGFETHPPLCVGLYTQD